MNDKERQAATNEPTFISRRAITAWPSLLEDIMKGRPIRGVRGREQSLFLVDDTAVQYGALLKRVLKTNPEWRRKFRDDDIIDRFNNLVGAACSEQANAQRVNELLNGVTAELEDYTTEQAVYVPLGGFEIDDQYTLRIGKVTLMQMSEARMNDLLQRASAVIAGTTNTPDEKAPVGRIYREWLARMQGNACVEYRVVADVDKARELAEHEASRALELLRIAIPNQYGARERVEVGFLWEVNRTYQVTPVVSADADQFHLHTTVKGPLQRYRLDQHTEKALRELGVLDIAKILERPEDEWTHFERQLLRAVHWFSDAQRQREVENVVTSLITCWEALFTPRNKDEDIMRCVSAGVAATAGTTTEERTYLRQRAKQLYDLRSDITHGRFVEMKQNDRTELLVIAHRSLMFLIPRFDQFKNKEELLAWVRTQEGLEQNDTEVSSEAP